MSYAESSLPNIGTPTEVFGVRTALTNAPVSVNVNKLYDRATILLLTANSVWLNAKLA